MAVPYTFATATSSIPLSQLDSNFSTPITLGNTSIQLGNTVTTLNNMTLANVSISSVASTFPNNYLANSTATLGNSTITLGGTTSSVGNLTLVNATISSGTYSVTDATVSGNLTLSGGTANGVAYLNGSKVLTTGSALTFDGTTFIATGAARVKAVSSGDQIRIEPGSAGSGVSLLSRNAADNDLTPLLSYGSYQTWYVSGGARAMDLTSTGLGIGTSSPVSKLHVESSSAESFQIGYSSTKRSRIGTTSAGDLQIYSYETGVGYHDVRIGYDAGAPAGNVLIGNNLGIGVTPSAWGTSFKALQVGGGSLWVNTSSAANTVHFSRNTYYDGSNLKYIATSTASMYDQDGGQHIWYTAPSGTAGNAITFTQAMTLDASGNLIVGGTSAPSLPITAFRSMAANNDATAGIGLVRFGTAYGSNLYHTYTTNIGDNGEAFGLIVGDGSAALTDKTKTKYIVNQNGTHVWYGATTSTERARIDSSGNFLIGTAAIATNATDGFLYIPTCAGTPTGTPTAKTGLAPMVIDSTNNKMYIYSGGAWNALN